MKEPVDHIRKVSMMNRDIILHIRVWDAHVMYEMWCIYAKKTLRIWKKAESHIWLALIAYGDVILHSCTLPMSYKNGASDNGKILHTWKIPLIIYEMSPLHLWTLSGHNHIWKTPYMTSCDVYDAYTVCKLSRRIYFACMQIINTHIWCTYGELASQIHAYN